MLNHVQLIGNIGKHKPEIRTTQAGKEVVTFSMATSESWKDKEGNWQQQTEWHRVVSFAPYVIQKAATLEAGSTVFVEGKITTRKYTDKQGLEKSTTEIVCSRLLSFDKKESKPTASQDGYQPEAAPIAQGAAGFMDEEIPF